MRVRHTGSFRLALRLLADDEGQDLVEYALLAGFIGISGWAALNFIASAVGTTYTSRLNPATGIPSVWNPPEPQ